MYHILDKQKAELAAQKGITIINIPFWWDWSTEKCVGLAYPYPPCFPPFPLLSSSASLSLPLTSASHSPFSYFPFSYSILPPLLMLLIQRLVATIKQHAPHLLQHVPSNTIPINPDPTEDVLQLWDFGMYMKK